MWAHRSDVTNLTRAWMLEKGLDASGVMKPTDKRVPQLLAAAAGHRAAALPPSRASTMKAAIGWAPSRCT